jgi:3-hydroxyisobutyrate dehydrogenase-like beta-hydroxyacid dehydrogenase
LALEAANPPGLKLPALDLVYGLFAKAIEKGMSNEGTQALISIVQDASSGSA